ncbi:MAG: hypothetical protein M1549_01840 [Candidatus Dependentiae bacterium]|nr:hypothetical protein [Candidatus Dependentiae bacterium]
MNPRTKPNAVKANTRLFLLLLSAFAALPLTVPANGQENEDEASNTVHSIYASTNTHEKLVNAILNGPAAEEIVFDELMAELTQCGSCFERLRDDAKTRRHEIQTTDLIAVIVENLDRLPLAVQDAIKSKHGRGDTTKLRRSLELFFNEAKALQLLANQLDDNPCKRMHWRALCERQAVLLRGNQAYTDFVAAVIKAKDASFVLMAKLYLRKQLGKLPKRIADLAKGVDARYPGEGEVVKRIFWEG